MEGALIRIVGMIVAIMPALVIIGYFMAAARSRPDWELLGTAYAFGAVSAIPAIWIASVFKYGIGHGDGFHEIIAIKSFMTAALPEEICKFGAVLAVCGRRLHQLSAKNLFVLSIAVAGGFASFENIFYVVDNGEWGTVAAIRSISAIPGHVFVGAVMGAFIVQARRKTSRVLWWGGALALPIVLHGTYNHFIFAADGLHNLRTIAPQNQGGFFIAMFMAIVVLEGIAAHISLRHILRHDRKTSSDPLEDGTSLSTDSMLYRILNHPFIWLVSAIACLFIALSIDIDATLIPGSNSNVSESLERALKIGFMAFALLHGAAFMGLAVVLKRRRQP